jgi:predicted DNA-binding transcriptional regulator AlpA
MTPNVTRTGSATYGSPATHAQVIADNWPHVMRPPEAASYLAISVQRLATMRLDGSGPKFLKLGRSVAYLREELDLWLRSKTRSSTSDTGGGA